MRKRYTLGEKYNLDINEVAWLILSSAKSYQSVEKYDEQTALQVAMSDYSFWYNQDPVRLIKLENLLERIKKTSNEPSTPFLKEQMDFQEGKIVYNHLFVSSKCPLNEQDLPSEEDLLYVIFSNRIALHVGCYGKQSTYRKEFFHVTLSKQGEENRPLFSKNVYTVEELKTVIEEAVNLYERWTK